MKCIYCDETLTSNEDAAEHAGTCPVMNAEPENKPIVHDMGEIAGVKLTYVNGNIFATPAKRGKQKG